MAGSYESNFTYFQNIGTASDPEFDHSQANPFGLSPAADRFSCTAIFADLDADGDLDLMSSDIFYSDFFYFENTGTATAPILPPHSPTHLA
jgi:hypothetical protein